jgi:hypothetical protein
MQNTKEEKTLNNSTQLPELLAIEQFLLHSENYKAMQKLCLKNTSKEYQDLTDQIKIAATFSEMLSCIDKKVPDLPKEPAYQMVSQTFAFFLSYTDSNASFVYSLTELRNEIIEYAVENHYKMEFSNKTELCLQ